MTAILASSQTAADSNSLWERQASVGDSVLGYCRRRGARPLGLKERSFHIPRAVHWRTRSAP